ncbi:MAG: ISNCY family transposase, partial [Treponema sp.]|nr:ISNCY family transposase [Treponema sp.]
LLGSLVKSGEELPDKRKGPNLKYTLNDAIKSAFGVFFFQFPSVLRYMTERENKRKRNNARSLLGVEQLPRDAQVRNLLDGIDPASLSPVFNETLQEAEERGVRADYRVVGCGVLLALDGVWYHASEQIQCEHCLHQDQAGVRTSSHRAVAGALVRPGCGSVVPGKGERITNEDGPKKQDCELTAAKRWVQKHGEAYKWLKPTLLGDDLYAHYPFCKQIREQGMSFICTYKATTHPWLSETIENSYVTEIRERTRVGKKRTVWTYRYLNGMTGRPCR